MPLHARHTRTSPNPTMAVPGQFRFIALLFLFGLLLLFFRTSSAQENFRVAKIEFVGNETISDDRLQQVSTIYGTSWFKQTLFGKEPFLYSDEALQSDLKQLRAFYQREGFLNVKVEKEALKVDEEDRKVELTIRITENAPIILNRFDYKLNDSSGVSQLNDIIESAVEKSPIAVDRRFRDAVIKETRDSILYALANNGYPYAEITNQVSLDEEEKTAGVTFLINPGPLARFGEITVSGNDRISNGLILSHVPFKKGDIFSRKLLDKAQIQIFSLGHFSIATVRADQGKEDNKDIPIAVNVQESPWLTSKIGLGYGREDRFRVFSDTRILSFPEEAIKLGLTAKHSYLEPYNFSTSLERPSFLALNTVLSLEPFIRREREPGYLLNRFGGNISLWHRFDRNLDGAATYTLERIKLDTTSIANIDSASFSQIDLYNKSSINTRVTFDNSDNRFSPTSGFNLSAIGKISGLGFGSDYDYLKLLLDLRRYQPLDFTVLAMKLKLGGIESVASSSFIPVEDRFFAGGANSVRGWSRGNLGPLDSEGTPIGGRSILEASLELRFPILGALSGVVFTDFGNVWTESYLYRLDELRYSAGAGLRYATPIGPIRLDVARPVNDRQKTTQLFISVGQAF